MFIIGRTRRAHAYAIADFAEEIPPISNDRVVLKMLTQADSTAFFRLYSYDELHDHPSQYPISPDDTPGSFAERVVATCELIWTIRLIDNPAVIIGDCALHHWEKENNTIEFGGSLLPQFWGKGIMQAALQLVTGYSAEQYNINTLAYATANLNSKAIRFAEKMGFTKTGIATGTIRWEKIIC